MGGVEAMANESAFVRTLGGIGCGCSVRRRRLLDSTAHDCGLSVQSVGGIMARVVMLSNEPYSSGFGSTNRQRLARAAVARGDSVTYVETVGWSKGGARRVNG